MPDAWVYYRKERKVLQCLNAEERKEWRRYEIEEVDMYCRMAKYAEEIDDCVIPYSICIQDGVVKLVERESCYTVEL